MKLKTNLLMALLVFSPIQSGWFSDLKDNKLVQAASIATACIFLKSTYNYLYPKSLSKTDQLVYFLNNNPLDVLNHAHSVGNLDNIRTMMDSYTFQEFKKMLEEKQKKCPIFLLGECNSCFCKLNRAFQPLFRLKYESFVVKKLIKKINTSDKTLQYVGFGSGGMFQDLIILTKTLTQKPHAAIDIHLIDPQFSQYLNVREKIGSSRHIKGSETLNITSEKALSIIRKLSKEDNVPVSRIQNFTILREQQTTQLIQFLEAAFPDAQLSLNIYRSTSDYIKHINQKEISYPDFIAAVDIIDESSIYQGVIEDYVTLCLESKKQNPASENYKLTGISSPVQFEDMFEAHIQTYSFKQENPHYKLIPRMEEHNLVFPKCWMSKTRIKPWWKLWNAPEYQAIKTSTQEQKS